MIYGKSHVAAQGSILEGRSPGRQTSSNVVGEGGQQLEVCQLPAMTHSSLSQHKYGSLCSVTCCPLYLKKCHWSSPEPFFLGQKSQP